MKAIRILFDITSWLAIAVIIVMVLYLLSSNYNIFAGYRSYLVQSGSMEPAIMTGDIIISRGQDRYLLNDVVTFRDKDQRVVTHRIVEIDQEDGGTQFSTKGDANRSSDFDTVSLPQIIGKVVFIVPKLGYLVAFSKSFPGIIILILIPATLFVIDELLKLKNA